MCIIVPYFVHGSVPVDEGDVLEGLFAGRRNRAGFHVKALKRSECWAERSRHFDAVGPGRVAVVAVKTRGGVVGNGPSDSVVY